MADILEEASSVVAARELQYYEILVDFYVMAGLSGDRETQQEIWDEAWAEENTELLVLLFLANAQ